MAFDLSKLSTTPASNDQANFFQTGMRPSAVKTAGWNLGSIVAQLSNSLTTGAGTANAQTLTNPVVTTTLTTGIEFTFLPGVANTGATTLNVDSLGAKNVFFNGAALVGGELQTTIPCTVRYDGTRYHIMSPVFISAQSGTLLPTATGSANAQAVANSIPFKTLFTGMVQWFLPVAANTGATTLAIDGLTATNIFYNGAALEGGELSTTIPVIVKYDGTQFNLLVAANTPAAEDIQNNDFIYKLDTGGVNTVFIGISPTVTAYADGQYFIVKVANTTTNNSVTLGINALLAKNIYYPDGTTQLLAGSLIQNNVYGFFYDSSLNAAAGGFICVNPSSILGSFTLSQTGTTVTQTGTANYRILPDGRTAHLLIPGLTGTSNATTVTWTGIPTILQTTAGITPNNVLIFAENNGAWALGTVSPANSSTWNIYPSIQGSAWTNTGSKGTGGPCSIVYPLS